MVFDVEGDGFHPTKIHVMSWEEDGIVKSTKVYEEMVYVLNKAETLVGHNIIRFDIPVLERILGVDLSSKRKIDTLALSWYLYPKRIKHGLEDWGEEFGVPKPNISDWENLSYEEYRHRCEEDVNINLMLYKKVCRDLGELYEGNYNRLVNYLTFKMECAREQERSKWKLDVKKCETSLAELESIWMQKRELLLKNLPEVPVKRKQKRPAKPYKKDGSFSSYGEKWFALLKDHELPQDYDGEVEVIIGYKQPNPGSTPQIKSWLFSLGWEPEHFEYKRNKETNEFRKIPQIKHEDPDRSDELCPSIMRLAEEHPVIHELAGFSQLTHRINFLKAMLEFEEDGWLEASIGGFTNTLRFKHKKPLANIPKVSVNYGDVIRSCLIADDGYELCGSDQSSLEDRTKLHFMQPIDPDYVYEMSQPGFDPHLDLAMQDGKLTYEEVEAYKNGDTTHKGIRHSYKTTNYAGLYGVRKFTLSNQLRCTEKEAEKLLSAYWKRNWSVLEVVRQQKTKEWNGMKWLFNPISKMWYYLKVEKDIFSTLNQGTGVYCFDTWVKFIRSRRPQMTAQFHDEVVLHIKKGNREKCEELLRWAVDKTNEKLQLNRELDIDVQFGENYAQIH